VSNLTAEGFEKLLNQLDDDSRRAGEKYEQLREKLTRFFLWRGVLNLHADVLADESLDRVAKKLTEGVEIENISAYACEVSRFVWLEHTRKNKEIPTDETPEPVSAPAPVDSDERLAYLNKCMQEVVKDEDERRLIVAYYDPDPGEKIKETRRKIAEKLGITTNYLKQKASRLRIRLEKCIRECIAEAG